MCAGTTIQLCAAARWPHDLCVAVRALCEFTAGRGDLDLRFTPAPTAQQGIAGHASVAARRASGYDAAINRLEEVKTYRGDLDAMPANHRVLHWA